MAVIDKTSDDTYILCWAQGDTTRKRMQFLESGSAKTVSGSVRLTVDEKKNPPLGDTTTRVFVINGTIVGDGSTGEVDFVPVTTDVTNIEAGTYYGVVRMVSGSNIETLIKLRVQIIAKISFVEDVEVGIISETDSPLSITVA